jgi:tRNA (guanine37-N1)-methyltransferase
MRVDVVTIFPEYLAPLGLSLTGKAQDTGLLDVHVHDLRAWTHDRHRTVDDTPYGGGAGMVMRPEPWGEALDAVATMGATLVVPTPSGEPFTQAVAAQLAEQTHLVFACGRYEGIDQRVVEHARATMPVREISLGDYVVAGGEVAALVVVEAVVRLLPGFVGNPESLAEESHGETRLLEYPVYTKPPTWRGLAVPHVLLSGDHRAIAAWRHEQAVRRTAERRPDLAHPSRTLSVANLQDAELRLFRPADAGELQALQWACFEPELREQLDVLTADVLRWTTFVLRSGGRLVGSVRGDLVEDHAVWDVGLLMVAPDLRGRGLGRFLLEYAEQAAPASATSYRVVTGAGKQGNIAMYKRAGYSFRGERPGQPGVVVLTKPRR